MEKIGNFRVFKSGDEAISYLEDQYSESLKSDDKQKEEIKEFFNKASSEGKVVGLISYVCNCGYEGEDPLLHKLSPEEDKYKELCEGGFNFEVCPYCRSLIHTYKEYGLDQGEAEMLLLKYQELMRVKHRAEKKDKNNKSKNKKSNH